ncbi:MAG TPA: M14 family metallopeptidase [Longimicrobiales bacterium]|nr:M14 family metallopeptidase [Longimicrobiales bacterium]
MRNLKACGSTRVWSLAALAAASLAMPGSASAQAGSYLDHEALTRELRALTQGSDLVRMRTLAKTPAGRDVWVLEVGNPAGAPLDERPGVLVVGNLEGDHLVGSALALEGVRHLVRHASEEAVKKVLDTQVLYVFPRLNPDGAEAMFSRVKWDRRGNGRAFDDDNDGRTDEDGPEDLNGDGYVTVMRVKDPAGEYLPDPADPRVMKRADASKGESGAYTLYFEGTDEDGDGFINEDGPGGVDLNRNFQHEYPYWQRDAGPYMVSEAESRALMDFVLANRNVAAIVTFGGSDNLVTPPDARGALAAAKILDLPAFAAASNEGVFEQGVFTSGPPQGFRGGGGGRGGGGSFLRGALPGANNNPNSGQRPATTVASEDQPYFKAVSDAYTRITGIKAVPLHRAPQGAFFQFGYFQYGVPSFSTPGWGLPAAEAAGAPERPRPAEAAGERPAGGVPPAGGRGGAQAAGGADAQILKGLDALGVQAFAEWKAYRHPTLGDVEIGGFLPYVATNPPEAQLPDLGEKHGRFLVELMGMLPRVRIAAAKVTANGGGVFTVEVAVENAGFFPTSTQHGVTSSTVGPVQVQIQVDAADILTGADKTVTVAKLDGSGAQERWTWVIRGRQGDRVEIKLRSEKGGTDLATVTLR